MRKLGRFLGRVIVVLVLLVVALWFFGQTEPIDTKISFNSNALGDDLDAYLVQQEGRFDDLTDGAQKQIIWAGERGAKTPLSIVYIHGWSATLEELRPVPDLVAKALGANLFYTRLAGHGRPGDALAAATAGEWIEDAAEAMAVGRRLGERVIVFGTSTGGTLAAEIVTRADLNAQISGTVLVSPNFRIADPNGPLLTLPFARYYTPLVGGDTREWEAKNELHAKYWTTSYPTVAVLPLAALVKHARSLDFSTAKTPALFIYTLKDNVVLHSETEKIVAAWGGKTHVINPEVPETEPKAFHLIAGDIIGPARTGPVAQAILDWANDL